MFDKLRSFLANCLHCDADADSSFCFPCIKALSIGFISSKNLEQAFIKIRFKKCKKALKRERDFPLHDVCDAHGKTVERFLKKGTDKTNGGMLKSSRNLQLQASKRKLLLKTVVNEILVSKSW